MPGTIELTAVSAVRPKVDDLTAALKKANRQASLDALEAYDAGWNGVEVYINVRSKALYDKLEGDLQHQLEEGLAAATPDFAALATVSEQLATEFDKAVALAKDGPAISPLFDDVTRLRITRADLRIANAALADGNVDKARAAFEKFAAGFDAAADQIKVRSVAGYAAVEDAFDAAKTGFADAAATAETLKPLGAALSSRYNFGVSLWNAAARNHDVSKATWSDADLAALEVIADIEEEVGQAVKFRAAGDFATAKVEIDEAIEHVADVEAALAAHNGADVTLKTALTNFAELIGPDADQAKAATAGQTAHDAPFVAQQVLVGAWWTDPALQAEIVKLNGSGPAASPEPGASAATGGSDGSGKVSANAATVEELAAALAAAGIANADRWAAEIEEYRPYPDDPSWAKLRAELGKYNIDPAVLEKIISLLKS
jgi:hypothetical protein